jgi:hypothetical protein
MNATIETAYGDANKTVFKAKADASTIFDVINTQVAGYKSMKTNLTFDNDQIMTYLKNSLIKDY